MASKVQAGPMMGAPKSPKPDAMHGYLGAHKQAFPTGYISMKPNLAQKERSNQGVVGCDVAKGAASKS